MADTNTNVCTHLTLGMCPYTRTETNAFGSFSTSNKKRKLCNKGHVGARKRRRNGEDLWKIKKMLKKRDVGNMGRLMLGRDMVEDLVLPMLGADADEIDKGVHLKIWDVDTHSMHSLIFKKWLSSKSYVFIGNWGKDFVARRGLKKGDKIVFQWNPLINGFNFSLLHVN